MTLSAQKAEGATVDQVSLPSVEYAGDAYSVIVLSEASTDLVQLDGVPNGVGGNWNKAFA